MKFWGIVRFELACQLRRGWPWVIFGVLLVLSFLMARDASVAEAMYEEFFANSPFNIARTTVVGGLAWLLLAPVVAGEAGARDVARGLYPLTYTAPVSRAEYLGGRFLAALMLNALLLLAVQAGIALGVHSPGTNSAVLGPFRPAAYLTAYLFVSLPTALAATAVQFAFAVRSGRVMAGYLGSLLLVFMGFFVASLLLYDRGLGSLLDPIGIRFIVEDVAHEWTTAEKSTRLLALEGGLLANRLVWTGVALAVLALTYAGFRFEHRTLSQWWWPGARRRRTQAAAPAGGETPAAALREAIARPAISAPAVPRSFGATVQLRQTLGIARASFRVIATSWAGLALLVAIPLMAVFVVLSQMGALGTPLVPTTARVLRELTGGMSAEMAAEPSRWVIVPLLLIFFAGELVWRERDAGVAEISDAMPGSEWTPLLGKFLGLSLVVTLFMALLAAAGMLAQTILGHREYEIGLYLTTLFGLQLPEYLLFAMLGLVVHVLVNHKYIGHVAAVLTYMFIAVLAGMLGIEHNLLVYGAGPGWSYTEVRGFGASLGPWLWFKLYWAAWAVLLAVLARLLWVRGRETGMQLRLAGAWRRVTRATAAAGMAGGALVLGLGGFIFYNTNVLNRYGAAGEVDGLRAEYERRYARYAAAPQPRMTAASLRLELYPDRGDAEIRGSYRLVNRSGVAIDSVHVAIPVGTPETRAMSLDRPATLALHDAKHGHRIYALESPLPPGDSLRLDFEVVIDRRGFHNSGVEPFVAPDGTYFTNLAWFPAIGYQRHRELLTASKRREQGLEPRPVIASLYDVEGREPASRGGGVMFDAVVGTAGDQVGVAPGALRRAWTEGGRRYFHYSTDAPIGSEWAFFSAGYAVHEARWTGSGSQAGEAVEIRIFHHPEHTGHLERMLRSVRASLDYYGKEFGPYPYGHLSIVEHPAAPGTGAHADPAIISHGQGFATWEPHDENRRVDMPYFVTAHEMAHQWTLPYALVEGVPFLSEGMANYFAIRMIEEARGEEQARRLLESMRRPYPYRPIRRGEPLLRALDPYLSRRRGPFAMYAMSEYAGTERVNGAVRRLIESSDAPDAPPVTTLDLYRELQAATPDSLQYLLHDLFEVNAFWSFDTERVTARPTGAGSWEVTLHVRAEKTLVDSVGTETELPMDELVEVGVFAPVAPGADPLRQPLYEGKHRVRSGRQTITVSVPAEPAVAGLDPYHLLDWEESSNFVEIDAMR